MDSDEDEEGGHDDGEGGVNVKATNGKPGMCDHYQNMHGNV
jgi:hypothetical protein